jgi:hypothetical protein
VFWGVLILAALSRVVPACLLRHTPEAVRVLLTPNGTTRQTSGEIPR